jgi:hypothetical protein
MLSGRLLVAALVVFGAACADLQAAPQPVAFGQLFSGPILNVRAPLSTGWLLLESDDWGMIFINRNESTGYTYAAEVQTVRLPPVYSGADLLVLAKKIMDARSPAARYKTVETRFEPTSERYYLCVRFRGTFVDTQALMPQGTTASLPLYIRSLICQHPRQRGLILDISFSQRGGPADPDLDSRAESFINSVEVHETR